MLIHGKEGSSARGFSLFEIMVVVALFALAAAVILPSFGGFQGIQLETSARDMVTRMKQARSEAIAQQTVFRILLKPEEESSSYALTDAYDEEIESFPLPEGFQFDGIEEESLKISFYPNGRSSGSEFGLKNKAGRTIEIFVDTVTGFARVKRPEKEGS